MLRKDIPPEVAQEFLRDMRVFQGQENWRSRQGSAAPCGPIRPARYEAAARRREADVSRNEDDLV
jgi:hypothetical protein